MKLLDMLKRSSRNLLQSKMRTLLTASAIAVGGFTLTVTLAAATGAKQYTAKIVAANFDPKSVMVAKDRALFEGTTQSGPKVYNEDLGTVYGQQVKQLTAKDVAKIKKIPHVTDVLENYQTDAQFITRPGVKRYTGTVTVYNKGQKPEVSAGTLAQGVPAGSVVLPEDYLLLMLFDGPQDAIGKTIQVQVRQAAGTTKVFTYKVAAVSTRSSLETSFSPTSLLLSVNDARIVNDFVNKGTVNEGKLPTVTVTTDGDPTAVKEALQHAGYASLTAEDAQKIIFQIINVLQAIVLVFGLITLIASFFGVVNTQYISVLERTREIGLMKALGMGRFAVSRLFIIEATIIGFIGAVVGSGLAVLLGTLLNPYISNKIHFGDQSLLVFTWWQIVALIAFLMLVTTIAGLLPAQKAAKLDPIEALRTE
jgi:putative ABC transport system permease protein